MSRLSFSRREFVIGALVGAATGAGITAAFAAKVFLLPVRFFGRVGFHTDRAAHIDLELYCR